MRAAMRAAGRSRARRRWGQHFLRDPDAIAQAVAAIAPRPGQRLVEIGPGDGALTGPLLDAAGALDAVEKDPALGELLRLRYPPASGLRLYRADALRFDYRRLCGAGGRLRLVGNLPYSISTPLLFLLYDLRECLHDMVFMLQREVAERLVSAPGNRRYGRLSVMMQCRFSMRRLFDVPAAAFAPPPRVESSMLHFAPRAAPLCAAADPALFAELVRRAFSGRRKLLRNALAGFLDARRLEAAAIPASARAEDLAPEDYARLAAPGGLGEPRLSGR